MKNKIFSFCMVGLLALVMAVPALAASSTYNFTMTMRVVDGSENGKYHSLKKGIAKISGSHHQYSQEKNAVGPYVVSYQLANKSSGNTFGTIKSTAPSDGSTKSFSGSYSSVGGGTSYYLLIWKVEDDGRNITGSGSVTN